MRAAKRALLVAAVTQRRHLFWHEMLCAPAYWRQSNTSRRAYRQNSTCSCLVLRRQNDRARRSRRSIVALFGRRNPARNVERRADYSQWPLVKRLGRGRCPEGACVARRYSAQRPDDSLTRRTRQASPPWRADETAEPLSINRNSARAGMTNDGAMTLRRLESEEGDQAIRISGDAGGIGGRTTSGFGHRRHRRRPNAATAARQIGLGSAKMNRLAAKIK